MRIYFIEQIAILPYYNEFILLFRAHGIDKYEFHYKETHTRATISCSNISGEAADSK